MKKLRPREVKSLTWGYHVSDLQWSRELEDRASVWRDDVGAPGTGVRQQWWLEPANFKFRALSILATL